MGIELGVEEARLTGRLRGSEGRLVFEREGIGEERGVLAGRYFEGPPKQASTSARSSTRSLSGESSDRSKEIASFPSALQPATWLQKPGQPRSDQLAALPCFHGNAREYLH